MGYAVSGLRKSILKLCVDEYINDNREVLSSAFTSILNDDCGIAETFELLTSKRRVVDLEDDFAIQFFFRDFRPSFYFSIEGNTVNFGHPHFTGKKGSDVYFGKIEPFLRNDLLVKFETAIGNQNVSLFLEDNEDELIPIFESKRPSEAREALRSFLGRKC